MRKKSFQEIAKEAVQFFCPKINKQHPKNNSKLEQAREIIPLATKFDN